MGEVLKSVFGGSDTKSQSTSGPVDITPPEIAGLRKEFVTTLTSLLGGGGRNPLQGIPTSQGTTGASGTENLAAPITKQEQDLLKLIGEDALDGGNGRDNLLRQTINGEFLPGGPQSNPFLQATIEAAQRPTFDALHETLSRSLPGKFAQAGQQTKQKEGSSAFDRAAALQANFATQAAADIATNISFASQEAERARQQGAATISQEEAKLGIEQLQASALPRLITQFGITEGTKEFQLRIDAVLKALQIATGTPLQTVANQSQSTGETDTDTGIIPGLGKLFSFSGTV